MKKSLLSELEKKRIYLSHEIKNIESKNNYLLSQKLNFDFVDILIREKFKFGKEGEIIIKLNE